MNIRENTAADLDQFEKTEVAKAVELQLKSRDIRDNISKTVDSVANILIGRLELNENDVLALDALDKINEQWAKYEKVWLLAMQYAIRQMANTSNLDVSEFDLSLEAANDDTFNDKQEAA